MLLKALMLHVPQVGRLEWIGLRSARRGPVVSVAETVAIPGIGLTGDRRADGRAPDLQSVRQVTLVQAEHLPVIAAFVGLARLEPEPLRRNLLVSGVNLLALKDRSFWIGEVLFSYSGPCHPCSRMEETLGPGGYNALRGHGGITARVVRGGTLHVGDAVGVATTDAP
ncbi:MOSC domain-containing protein [soil metagenome]